MKEVLIKINTLIYNVDPDSYISVSTYLEELTSLSNTALEAHQRLKDKVAAFPDTNEKIRLVGITLKRLYGRRFLLSQM
jgi:hypothetical protein